MALGMRHRIRPRPVALRVIWCIANIALAAVNISFHRIVNEIVAVSLGFATGMLFMTVLMDWLDL